MVDDMKSSLPTQSWKVSLSMVGKLPLTTLLLCRITLSTWALVRGDTAAVVVAVVVVVVVDVVVVPDVTVKKEYSKTGWKYLNQ